MMQCSAIQCSTEMALGGTQGVPGQSVVTPVMPSGAIAQHVFCYFSISFTFEYMSHVTKISIDREIALVNML